ncbi:MAG: hypothetical protein ACSHYC_05520 [Alphaproteobacteria bacterium]
MRTKPSLITLQQASTNGLFLRRSGFRSERFADRQEPTHRASTEPTS